MKGKRGPRPDPPAKAPARKRRAPAHLPEPRGRHGHKKLDEMPELRDQVREWINETPRPTYDELHQRAAAWLAANPPEHDDSIGRTAIRRWVVDYEAAAAEREDAIAFVKAFNDLARDGEALSVEEAVALIYNQEILRDLRKRVGQGIDPETDGKMHTFFKGQSSSAVRVRAQLLAKRAERKALLWVVDLAKQSFADDDAARARFVNTVRTKLKELQQ